jgi:hypothetical protein
VDESSFADGAFGLVVLKRKHEELAGCIIFSTISEFLE